VSPSNVLADKPFAGGQMKILDGSSVSSNREMGLV
jgi:hypothetical protein